MAKLVFDNAGEHYYENGVDHGVLFVENENGYSDGVVWNGLTNVTLSPEGAEPNDIYADNIKYLSLMSVETLKATIEAYQSPEAFDACDGSLAIGTSTGATIGQQERKKFAFAFRTKTGSDKAASAGYKIHVVCGCLAAPSERAYETINDSPDAMTLSWEVSTTPETFTYNENEVHTSLFEIESKIYTKGTDGKITVTDNPKYKLVEESLYGTDTDNAKFTSIDALVKLITPTQPAQTDESVED